MDIKGEINKVFDSFIETKFQNENIRSFLKNHERRHLLVNNLKAQIDKSANVLLKASSPLEDKREIIKSIVKDFANNFCTVALNVKEAEILNGPKLSIKEAVSGEEESLEDLID